MTREEYESKYQTVESGHDPYGLNFARAKQVVNEQIKKLGKDIYHEYAGKVDLHEMFVRKALSKGKPVPPEVLADYPDLAKKYGVPESGTVVPEKGTEPTVNTYDVRFILKDGHKGYLSEQSGESIKEIKRKILAEESDIERITSVRRIPTNAERFGKRVVSPEPPASEPQKPLPVTGEGQPTGKSKSATRKKALFAPVESFTVGDNVEFSSIPLKGKTKSWHPAEIVGFTEPAVTERGMIDRVNVKRPDGKIIKGIDTRSLRKTQPSSPTTLGFMGANPDVAKGLVESAGQGIAALGRTDVVDGMRKILLPAGRGPFARQAAESIRANLGEMNRSEGLAYRTIENAQKQFDRMPPEESHAFMDAVETGTKQANPQLDAAATSVRGILDGLRDEIKALGTGKLEHFYENYFPHIWKDPKAAGTFFGNWGKRPFEGKKSFLKKRTIPTIREGLEAGLELVSDNPMDLVMAKSHEMRKYLMAHRVLAEFKDNNMLQFVRAGHRPPDGFALVNDRISSVTYRNEAGEMITSGHYYLPEQAAQVLNNYLSPGLRGSKTFRAYRTMANTLNQAQLGLSAYHLGFTSLDAAVSKFGLGTMRVSRGQFGKGLRDMMMTLIAPITNAVSGNRLYKAYYDLGAGGAEMGKFVKSMVAANGVPKMDAFYKTKIYENMRKAWRQGDVGGAVIRIPGAVLDLAAKPIMEYVVPRQKLGVFLDMMRMEYDSNPNMTPAELRTVAQKAWNSVDNRMGQLVYDNLFWNNVAKDLAMASIRSVGWNVGTIREVAGGGVDILRQVGKIARNEKPELTYRMSYVMALPIVVGTMGAITQYLMTGRGPQSLKDYYFPQTGGTDERGDPNRVSLPSYMKDLYHYSTAPGQTVRNKLHPILGTMAEMLNNEDFYGTKIRNEDDPLYRQIYDLGVHAGKAFEPLGFRNIERQRQVGEPWSKAAASFVGITPAPKGVNQTAAEQMANEYVRQQIPIGSRTKEQAEESRFKSDLRRQYLKGNKEPMQEAYKTGKLTNREVKSLVTKDTPLQRSFSRLPVDKAMKVFEIATPEEKETLKVDLGEKMVRWAKSASPEDKKRMLPAILAFRVKYGIKGNPTASNLRVPSVPHPPEPPTP